MHELASTFVEKLKQRDDVLAIMLFGSWARGTNRPDSDTDLLVILSEGFERTVEFQEDHPIEVTYTTSTAAVEFWNSNLDDCADLWSVAEILYSKDETAEQLRDTAAEILANGKPVINAARLTFLRFDTTDQLRSIEFIGRSDPATARMMLSNKVYDLTGLFFDIRRIWTPPPKQRLARIQEIDLDLHRMLTAFYGENAELVAQIRCAQEIAERVLTEHG